ncbi:DUF6286 domain-containing protein [Amycolatopsis sp. WQ 127309]|uniref:DUF6286 domain-containing protein n=1 Tax=Amycolatopsis sp. WQ 127309 TaxID=2932773 RepID=UPI001FF4AA9B|nr:DUF6286 domain-containing protein [Amycolatopsis sp. WQ 127309]UOZ04890.1 alkaline shock response membrane anchor protein AmaP [Amycolatopsis sp. WQ 127309]
MKRRTRRGVPATLTAVVLLAACVVVAVVAIQMIAGATPWLSYPSVARTLHDAHWNDPVPAVAGGVSALLGVILLLAAMLPGRLTVLPLEGEVDSGASRRSYRSTLRSAASTVDGVSRARVKLRRRSISAEVTTGRTNTDGLADAVSRAIERRLDQLTPVARPAVRVRVHAARSTS